VPKIQQRVGIINNPIMKKYLLLGMLICSILVNAQDVIITTDAKKINATVLEVSDVEVKYLEQEMQDGPTFILPTTKIATIIFANGQVKTFGQIKEEKTVIQENITPKLISRSGNTYWYDGMAMRGKTYEIFLQNNCTPAYDYYKKGKSIANAGWALLGTAATLNVICNTVLMVDPYILEDEPVMLCMALLGYALEIACIPTLIVGYNKRHNSANIYNNSCASQPQAYFSINASQNGVGLAFNF
jgi:hypothetical protein